MRVSNRTGPSVLIGRPPRCRARGPGRSSLSSTGRPPGGPRSPHRGDPRPRPCGGGVFFAERSATSCGNRTRARRRPAIRGRAGARLPSPAIRGRADTRLPAPHRPPPRPTGETPIPRRDTPRRVGVSSLAGCFGAGWLRPKVRARPASARTVRPQVPGASSATRRAPLRGRARPAAAIAPAAAPPRRRGRRATAR